MEQLTITEIGPLKTFGDNGKEWVYKVGSKSYSTYWPKVSEVIVLGGTYQCEIEVNTKGKYPKSVIKSAEAVGVTAQAATIASPLPTEGAAGRATSPALHPQSITFHDDKRNDSIEWQVSLKEAGAIVREFAEAPEWFRKGLIDLLALKLGIDIPDVVDKATVDKIGTLAAQAGMNYATFEKGVKEKHNGRKIAELTNGEGQSVIATLDLMIANLPPKQEKLTK
jgi:hypothetical protein